MRSLTIATNTIYQVIARFATSFTAFIATIFIAHSYGSSGYGDFTKVTALVGLTYVFADFGLNALYLQKDPEEKRFTSLLAIRLLFSLVLAVGITLVSLLLPYNSEAESGFSPQLQLGVLVFSLTIASQALLMTAQVVFQKQHAFKKLLIANLIGSGVTLAALVLFTLQQLPLLTIFLAYSIGGLVSAFTALWYTRKRVFPLTFNRPFLVDLLKESVPLFVMLVFNLVYFRIDTIFLSVMKSSQDVGYYGLAYKFFDFLIALPLFLSNVLYPLLLEHKHKETFFQLVQKYVLVFLLFSFAVVFVAWFVTPLFGLIKPDFVSSVLPFRILLLSLPVFFLTNFLQWVLIVKRKQHFLMWVYLGAAIVNIVLNFVFIPLYSYVASAIITGVCETIVLIALLIRLQQLRIYERKA